MHDRLSRTAPGAGGGNSDSQNEPVDHDAGDQADVLGILEDIESQFDRLRTIRSDQVDSLRELAERSDHLEQKKAALAKLRGEVERRRRDWTRKRRQDQSALDESRHCLEADRGSHARRVEEDKSTLARDRTALDKDRERSRKEDDARRTGLDQDRAALDQLRSELDERSMAIRVAQMDLDSRQERVDQEAVNQEDCHQNLLEALQVAREAVGKRGRRVRALDQVVESLRRDRSMLRSRRRGLESAGRTHRKHIERLKTRLAEQDARLEEAARRMRNFMELLRDQADLVQRGNAALAVVDSLEGRIAELQEELEKNNRKPGDARRIASLEEELSSTREELAQRTANQALEATTEDRSRRLAQIARHLHLRRSRLKRVRAALQSRDQRDHAASNTVEQRLRQSEIIEQRQQELDDVRRMLTNSEKMMIKRWAAPRSIELASWTLVILGVIAIASWFIAERIRPAVRTASVTLSTRLPDGAQPDATLSNAWQDFHESRLHADGFIRNMARRASARRLAPWNTHESVRRVLGTHLAIDSGNPNQLVFTLASSDPDRAAAFLDLLATSMAIEAQRTSASRPGGYATQILDNHKDDGALRYARINPSPLQDDRVMTASLIFGGGVLLSFMVMGVIYTRLIRAKQIFEQAHPEDLGLPPMPVRPI